MPLGRISGHSFGIEEFARRLFRTGIVESVYPERGLVRVFFEDQGDMEHQGMRSWEFQVLQRKTLKDKDYWMPDVGEHVVCLQLPYGSSEGFVVGAFYSDVDVPPVSSQSKRHVSFSDGSWVEYDTETHKMRVQVKGEVFLESAVKIIIRAPEIELLEGAPQEEIQP
jgi:phage baseplate assembly protein V